MLSPIPSVSASFALATRYTESLLSIQPSALAAFSLAGRRALVTGASRGIGRAIALGLAQAGATVAVSGRKKAALEEVVTAINNAGGVAVPVVQDVTRPEDCRRGTAQAIAALGGLDILINNAGMEEVMPSLEIDEALWDRILDTNLKGAFFCAQAAAAEMKRSEKGGAIINLCSLTSYRGIPTAVPYGASKTGLLGMTRALAAEWAPMKIRVNAVAPGYFRTELTEVFYHDASWQEAMLRKIPQGRFGQFDDLTGAAIFLASDAAAYITGQCLGIDGGTLAAL
jgi:NAD(P)-dependent dehydrogenase (short-subunit alcohol dehydrogenase family)